MAEKKAIISGHTVVYDSSTVASGIYHLAHQLSAQEVKVFFDQAFSKGTVYFENRSGTNFKLVHHGGEYQLEKA